MALDNSKTITKQKQLTFFFLIATISILATIYYLDGFSSIPKPHFISPEPTPLKSDSYQVHTGSSHIKSDTKVAKLDLTKLEEKLTSLEKSLVSSLERFKPIKEELNGLKKDIEVMGFQGFLKSVEEALGKLEKDPLESPINSGRDSVDVKLKKYVVVSVNINAMSGYFYHLPIVVLAWRRVSYEPIFIIVRSRAVNASRENEFTLAVLARLRAKVFFFEAQERFETTSAMIAREMVGLLPEELVGDGDFVVTSDADLYPVSARHYEVGGDESIKIWNGQCCGLFKHRERNYTMFPMGHMGMRKYQWREVMGLDQKTDKMDGTSVFNLINKFNGVVPGNNQIQKGNDFWDIDQKMASVYIFNYVEQKKATLTHMPRDSGMRLDRSQNRKQWQEYLNRGIKDFNDVHTMQNIVSLLQIYDLKQLLFEQLFSRRIQVLLDKYTLEFIQIINVTTIPFNKAKYQVNLS